MVARLSTLMLLLGFLETLSTCGALERPAPEPPEEEDERRFSGPSQAICDPGACPLFCLRAMCGGAREACETRCRQVCGDGYFDDRDGPVIACVLAEADAPCGVVRTCCDTDYTSQLCVGVIAPVPAPDAPGKTPVDAPAPIDDNPEP